MSKARYRGWMGAALVVVLLARTGPEVGAAGSEARNMALVGHHDLQGRSAYQPVIQAQAGRWIAYVGHHGGSAPNPLTGREEPNGTSVIEVTDPANPVYLAHIPGDGGAQMAQICRGADLPVRDDRVYLLRANGNVSHELWDVTDPARPKLVSTPLSGGSHTHKNWWDCATGIAYMVYDGTQAGWKTNRLLWVMDLSNPAKPALIRRFGLAGQEPGALGPAPPGAHEATLSPDGRRLFVAYGTANNGVMQIVDVAKLLACRPGCPGRPARDQLLAPQVGRLDMPRFWGGHTAWPVMGMEVAGHAKFAGGARRDFVVLVSESLAARCGDEAHHMVFMVDITDETRPFPVANYQVRESQGDYCSRGGRFGAHAVNWSYHAPFYRRLVFVSYFNAGVRAVDIRDPFQPKEAGHFIPAPVAGRGVIQTNNVELDGRGYVYLADRAGHGLHIVRYTGEGRGAD